MTYLYPGSLYGDEGWISFGLYCGVKNELFVMIEFIYFADDSSAVDYTYDSEETEIYEI